MELFKKNIVNSTTIIHDHELENLRSQLKSKYILFGLNAFLVFIWAFVGTANLQSDKTGVALINFFCAIMWLACAILNYFSFKKIEADIAVKIEAQIAVENEKKEIESLNFFAASK